MSETTVVEAAPSAAIESIPEIPRSGTPEYAEWRMTGELPEKKQPETAETAAADLSKATNSDESGDSAPTKTQEKPGKRRPDVEARFKQYTDRIDKLERDLEEARRPKSTQAESSTARPAPPQNYQEWRKAFKPSQWIEDYAKANPAATYEDSTAAMYDHLGDVRDQFHSFEQQRQILAAKVNEARSRYGDSFDEVVKPTATVIQNDQAIPFVVKAMLDESEVMPDVVYTIGSDKKTLNDFIALAKSQPGKALRYLAVVEHGIIEELAKGRNDKGQFMPKSEPSAPVKRGPESAPEPPLEVGNRGSGTMDESERAFKAIERGDTKATRDFLRSENAKDLRRRRGA